MFYRFLTDEEGATSIEYALIASLIAVAIVGSLQAVAEGQKANSQVISDAMQSVYGGGGGGGTP